MSHVLPTPTRSLAIPLATLVLGAGCGVAATAVLNDEEIVFRSSPPAAVVDAPKSTAVPVPERITNAPAASSALSQSKGPVPVPERVAPQPQTSSPAPAPERVAPQPQTSSLSGIGSDSPPPVPERVSGAHAR
jgi:hypothetical protein